MRRALLILLLLLCGAGPAQKRLLLQPSYEQLIRQHGPTLWLDASDPTTITATATAVSQWSDKSGNARHFVQATGANQPSWTRPDGLENRLTYSQDFADATWTKGSSSIDATPATDPLGGSTAYKWIEPDSASTDHYFQRVDQAYVAGSGIVISIYAKAAERTWFRIRFNDGATKSAWFDVGNGVVGSVTAGATNSIENAGGGWYRCIMTIASVSSSTATGQIGIYGATGDSGLSYAGEVGKGAYFWGFQYRSSLASSNYLATTTYPVYRGINGRSAVRFDGAASYMTSAATTGDVFAAGAKTQFIVYRSSSTGYLFTNAGTARWYGYIDATPDLNLVNSDGTADLAVSALAAHNLSHIGQALHSAGNIYAGIDGSLSAATASGDTAALTNALWIGARSDSSNWYTGDIAELLTFNKVFPSDVRIKIERGLCRKWGADC